MRFTIIASLFALSTAVEVHEKAANGKETLGRFQLLEEVGAKSTELVQLK